MSKQLCRYQFTLKKDWGTPEQVVELLVNHIKVNKYCFQLELGSSDYEHYQGRLSFKSSNPKRINECKNMTKEICPAFHWSIESNAGEKAGAFYVMKDDTRLAGPWMDKNDEHYIPLFERNLVLRPTQQWIKDKLDKQNMRQMLFIVDDDGHFGKTQLVNNLCNYHNGVWCPPAMATSEAILQFAYAMVKQEGCNFLVDIPRASDKGWEKLLSACETIKGGWAYDPRYTYKFRRFEYPHILILSNAKPPEHLLTHDRFQVYHTDEILKECGEITEHQYEVLKSKRRMAEIPKFLQPAHVNMSDI